MSKETDEEVYAVFCLTCVEDFLDTTLTECPQCEGKLVKMV